MNPDQNDPTNPPVVPPAEQPAPEPQVSSDQAPVSQPTDTPEPVVAQSVVEQPVVEQTPAQPAVSAETAYNPFATQVNAPQPAVQTPAAPVAPAPEAVPAGAPQPPQAPKSRKKLIILLSSIGGAVLLLAAAVTLYLIFLAPPSKEDYREAKAQYDKVMAAASDLEGFTDDSTALTDVETASEEEVASLVKDARDDIEAIKKENETLGSLRAVRVGDGKELYEAFDAKLSAYVTFYGDLVTTMENVAPSIRECSKGAESIGSTSSYTSQKEYAQKYVSVYSRCAELYKGVSAPNATFAAFLTKAAKLYDSLASIFDRLSTMDLSSGTSSAGYSSVMSEIYSLQQDAKDATDELEKEGTASEKEYSISETGDALSALLVAKQN